MTNNSIQVAPGGCAGGVARMVISLFLLGFLMAGLFICANGISEWNRELSTRRWTRVPCIITRSRVMPRGKDSAGPYEWEVQYRYDWAGQSHTSGRYTLDHKPAYDFATEERLSLQYPRGDRTSCWVDPADPSKAVLGHDPAYSWLIVPFGLVFVLIGGVPLLLMWRAKATPSAPAAPATRAILSATGATGVGRSFGVVVFLIFLFGGAAMIWFLWGRPALRARAAETAWTKVPCKVLYSSVATHPARGKSGPTYSVDVLYQYSVGGRVYRSNQFSVNNLSTSGYDSKLAVARQYPRGRVLECYVNPADPTDAVLQPNVGGNGWGIALPAVFVLVGLFGLVSSLRGGRRGGVAGTSGAGPRAGASTLASPNSEMLTLRLSERPLSRFIGFLLFSLIFDGALALVVWQFSAGHVGGIIFPALWTLVWGAACLGLTAAAVHAGLAMLNPRATVTLARGAVPPGGVAELQWTFDGRYDPIRRLTLRLEGRERATYSHGTHTSTDTHVLAKLPLFESDRNDLMARGKCTLHVPAGTMHTFRAAHNEIRWFVMLQGEIPNWPDVKEEFEIEVPPPAIQSAAPVEKPPALPAETLARPGSFVAIRTTDGRTAFSPGEPVAGNVAWSLPAIPKRLEVRLFWFTRGKGTPDVQIVDQVAIDNPPMQGEHAFTFHAPNGPYSFSGKLISLMWGLEVLAEPKDRSDRIEIVCAPGGREIVPEPTAPGITPVTARIVIGR